MAKKKKLKKKGIIVIILTLYLIIMAFYYVFTMPVKNIVIKGNILVSDEEIIRASKIDNNTKLFPLNHNEVIKSIKNIALVENVSVKKNLNGTVNIIVTEAKALFYNVLNKKYTLSNGEEVDNISSNLGIPVLVNYVPKDIYAGLIKKMSASDNNIISLISEIEYSPAQVLDKQTNEYKTTDAERFLLRMNDGNYVYINIPNFGKINLYEQYYATIDEGKKGIFELDSNSDNVLHKLFEDSTGGEEDELSQ